MNGTERAIEPAMRSGLPNMPRSSAQYASNGLTPMSAIRTPPTMNDSRTRVERDEHRLEISTSSVTASSTTSRVGRLGRLVHPASCLRRSGLAPVAIR